MMTSNDTSNNRRRFLQNAAGAVAVTSLATATTRGADIPRVHSGDGSIRVGLVGCGGRGNGAAINAMSAGQDIKIVALGDLFDDSIAAGLVTPGLTSVRQPMDQVARWMIDTLVSMLAGGPVPQSRLLMPDLVVRESTA